MPSRQAASAGPGSLLHPGDGLCRVGIPATKARIRAMAWSWRRTLKSLLQKAETPRAAGIRLARTIDWSSAAPGRDTVLCLDRSQFIKDIEELRRFTGLNWVTLNAVKLK